MPDLYAGAARRVINPPRGIRTFGFSSREGVVQAIESDLTATALVLSDGKAKVAIVAADTGWMDLDVMTGLRERVADRVGTNSSHVMINLNHTHSSPAMPEWFPDKPEQIALQTRYQENLCDWIAEAAREADERRVPARIGAGWGDSRIGVYRRETDRDGEVFLGEVPDHPTDSAVGVMRVDDLDGNPIATLFSYGCHPVTVGPKSLEASPDFPGAARTLIENSIGGTSLFLQGCGGNIMPRGGLSMDADCRDEKDRTGYMLGAEVVKTASEIHTHRKRGARRSMGSLSRISVWPWEPRHRRVVHLVRRRGRNPFAAVHRPASARRGPGHEGGMPRCAKPGGVRWWKRVGNPCKHEICGLGRPARRSDRNQQDRNRHRSPGHTDQRHHPCGEQHGSFL